ncbi:hydrophilin Pga14p [Diutina catenulata]
MKFTSVVAIASTAALVAAKDKPNHMEVTKTITKEGWNPKATHKYGRFDHTTRVATTTVWTGEQPSAAAVQKRAVNGTAATNGTNGTNGTGSGDKENAANHLGVAGAVIAGALLLL